MKLYSFQPSPFGARIRLALRRKGLKFEIAPPSEVDAAISPFIAPSPMEVPTLLTDDGVALAGSTVILDFLEDAFPAPPLLPRSPAARAKARMLTQLPEIYLQNAPRRLFGMADPAQRDAAKVAEEFALIETALSFIDGHLDDDSAGGWAVGGRASIADCALLPVLNAIALVGIIHRRADIVAAHGRLNAYWQAARRDALNAALLAEQITGLPEPLQAAAARLDAEEVA